jgi:hypothetical protein
VPRYPLHHIISCMLAMDSSYFTQSISLTSYQNCYLISCHANAESVICTGRMSSIMPILYFICKELRVPSTDYYMLIRNSGLDRFQGSGKSITSTTTTNQGS